MRTSFTDDRKHQTNAAGEPFAIWRLLRLVIRGPYSAVGKSSIVQKASVMLGVSALVDGSVGWLARYCVTGRGGPLSGVLRVQIEEE